MLISDAFACPDEALISGPVSKIQSRYYLGGERKKVHSLWCLEVTLQATKGDTW